MATNDAELIVRCHWMLLRLAGSTPDDLLATWRWWLGEGRVTEVGRSVSDTVPAQRLSLTRPDLDLLADLVSASAADGSVLAAAEVAEPHPMPMWAFAPTRAWTTAALRPAGGDASPVGFAPGDATPEPPNELDLAVVDLAVVDLAVRRATVRAVWRAWRYRSDGVPSPRRVYVLETDPDADLSGTTLAAQDRLAALGEPHPQVEVYPMRGEPPSYLRLARSSGALLWSREPDPRVRLARLFDSVDQIGPQFAPDRPVVAADEARRLVAYLLAGEPLLLSPVLMDDILDQTRAATVPMNFRTDGTWVWCEACTYYLETYRLAPDPELLAHVRRRRYVPAEVDGAARHRALAVLSEPLAGEPT